MRSKVESQTSQETVEGLNVESQTSEAATQSPSAPDIRRWTFNERRSTLDVQRWTFLSQIPVQKLESVEQGQAGPDSQKNAEREFGLQILFVEGNEVDACQQSEY